MWTRAVTWSRWMTLHSSKGTGVFPWCSWWGWSRGLFPNHRSLEDPAATRRRTSPLLRGHYPPPRSDCSFPTPANAASTATANRPGPSPNFWGNCPTELVTGNKRHEPAPKMDDFRAGKSASKKKPPPNPAAGAHEVDWNVGDVVVHQAYGAGEVTHILWGRAPKFA